MLKKISKFIKNNYKFIIGFVLGLVVASSSVYAANTIYSKNVTYDNSNSGLEATNVQDALDETYTKCFPPVLATDKIMNLYNDGSNITEATITSYDPKVYLNTVQKIMLDDYGNYRYYGKRVNNYVKFNDELWRIIGVFPDIDDGTGKKETRLKIIRSESIGKYVFGDSNDWTNSELQEMLNTLYYNNTSGSCYDDEICDFTSIGLDSVARSMIDNAKYYLGETTMYGSTNAYSYFEYERSGGSWTGKIGIIYPSDYVFARDYSFSSVSDQTNNNWLYTGNQEWTITPSDISDDVINFIKGDGDVDNELYGNGYVFYSMNVLPVTYLKSNVIINGGTGTESDPYTLKL